MTGYALHPEAFNDIDEIRAFIAGLQRITRTPPNGW